MISTFTGPVECLAIKSIQRWTEDMQQRNPLSSVRTHGGATGAHGKAGVLFLLMMTEII